MPGHGDFPGLRDGAPAHWFCAFVGVFRRVRDLDCDEAVMVAYDVLGGCSYNSFDEFVSLHRQGPGAYFPDMVRTAIKEEGCVMLGGRAMDCKNIAVRLREISREARALQKLLDNGNTGHGFDAGLNVIEVHLQALRDEIRFVPVREGV